MLNEKQLQEYASLRNDLLAMDLPMNKATDQQLDQVSARVKQSLSPAIWRDLVFSKPITQEYAVIMNDPRQDDMMILLVLWPANSGGQVHDHLTWAVIGVARGVEENQIWHYQKRPKEKQEVLVPSYREQFHPGDVCVMQHDNIIHNVTNLAPANKVSISIHVYGRDLRTTGRKTYYPDRNEALPNQNDEFISLVKFIALSD